MPDESIYNQIAIGQHEIFDKRKVSALAFAFVSLVFLAEDYCGRELANPL